MKDEIDQLLRGKIIELGKGPWSSPIVPVRKPDGTYSGCSGRTGRIFVGIH